MAPSVCLFPLNVSPCVLESSARGLALGRTSAISDHLFQIRQQCGVMVIRDLLQCHEHWKEQQTAYLSCLQGPDSRPSIIQGKKTGQESCIIPTDLAKLLSLAIVSVLVTGDLLMPGKLLLPGGGVSTFSSHHEMVVFRASWSWNMT